MMKKKGCDCMFKKLVMLLCFGILLSFSTVSAQANDELPPLVIETDDVKYAGINIDWSKNPSIRTREDIILYKEPSLNSSTVGKILANERVSILKTKAYIYPRMGKTKIVNDINTDLILSGNIDNVPKIGNTVYLIYYSTETPAVIWYENNFFIISNKSIKMPDNYLTNKDVENFSAIYEGYISEKDTSNDFKPYQEYVISGDNIGESVAWKNIFFGYNYRRNADVWLYLENANKKKGWVQFSNAYLGANEQIWWRQQFLGDAEGFNNDVINLKEEM